MMTNDPPSLPPGTSRGVVRVLIADDHRIVRYGLRHMIGNHAEFQVVGEATDGEEAVALARELRPDVIIMDAIMPRVGGAEATRRIKQENPAVAVICLSINDDEEIARSMREAGAVAHLIKDCHADELLAAIRAVRG